MKKQKNILGASLLAALLVAATSAHAITFNITSDHSTDGLGTAPYGTVTVLQNATTVDVTVHLLSGYAFVLTGAADFQDFKFNATGVALADITINQNAPYTLVAGTGAFNGDGTGTFGFGITGTSQPNGAAGAFTSDIIFHVANATIADLTAANSLGNIFVADLLQVSTGHTGPADVSTPGVPDGGSTLVLLGSALASLSFFARRRKV